MLETKENLVLDLPRGTYSKAAKQLGVSREYISQVVRGEFGETDRVVKVWAVINTCAEEIKTNKEERKNRIKEIKEKYAA